MATIITHNIGAAPNDGSGDSLRQAFIDVNSNTASINAELISTTEQASTNAGDIAALTGSLGALANLDTVGTAQIDNNSVTLAKLADIATASFIGRQTAATGDPEVLSASQARAILNVANGATANNGGLADLNTVGTAQIDNNSVTLAKLGDIATSSILGRVTATTGDPEILTAAQVRTLLNVADGATANTGALADLDTVGTAQIDNSAVTTAKILDLNVTEPKIAANAVTANKIADDAVTNGKILNGSVSNTKLATDAVATGNIVDDAVTEPKIGPGAVNATGLANDAVTTAKILNANVTEAKLADGAVTRAKLGARTVNAQIDTAHSIVATDQNGIVTMDNAAANTVTINLNATTALNVGHQTDIVQIGAGVTTIDAVAGVTLNNVDGGSTTISARFSGATLLKLATDTWVVFGNIAAVA